MLRAASHPAKRTDTRRLKPNEASMLFRLRTFSLVSRVSRLQTFTEFDRICRNVHHAGSNDCSDRLCSRCAKNALRTNSCTL